MNIKLSEYPLSDEYPLYYDYLYVFDNEVVKNKIPCTVREAKQRFKVKEIKNCDIFGRMALQEQSKDS